MIFNSKRQSGKTMYIVKRAVQYQEEYLNSKGKRPVIVVPNERFMRFVKNLIFEKYHRIDIDVIPITIFIHGITYPHCRVLVDEAEDCLRAVINRNNAELTECTMTVPTFDDPLRQILKEIY